MTTSSMGYVSSILFNPVILSSHSEIAPLPSKRLRLSEDALKSNILGSLLAALVAKVSLSPKERKSSSFCAFLQRSTKLFFKDNYVFK